MDFKEATDRLGELGVTQEALAEACGVSWASIKAARLPEDSPSKRPPPSNWREAIIRLARQRGGELEGLAAELEAGG